LRTIRETHEITKDLLGQGKLVLSDDCTKIFVRILATEDIIAEGSAILPPMSQQEEFENWVPVFSTAKNSLELDDATSFAVTIHTATWDKTPVPVLLNEYLDTFYTSVVTHLKIDASFEGCEGSWDIL